MPRLKIDNARQHIFNRGNQKQTIFHNDQDFESFLSIIAHYKLKYGFNIYHLCVMLNHFHLDIKFKEAAIMPKAMKDVALTYTNYYHHKYGTVGQLWQGRYKNMVVEEERYADRLGGYIERNPLRAGLVKNPGEWKWSSYRFYAYREQLRVRTKRNGKEVLVDLIDEDPLYKQFGATDSERQENYRKIVFEINDDKARKYFGLAEKRRGRPKQK